jgi:hypothetical protein
MTDICTRGVSCFLFSPPYEFADMHFQVAVFSLSRYCISFVTSHLVRQYLLTKKMILHNIHTKNGSGGRSTHCTSRTADRLVFLPHHFLPRKMPLHNISYVNITFQKERLCQYTFSYVVCRSPPFRKDAFVPVMVLGRSFVRCTLCLADLDRSFSLSITTFLNTHFHNTLKFLIPSPG